MVSRVAIEFDLTMKEPFRSKRFPSMPSAMLFDGSLPPET